VVERIRRHQIKSVEEQRGCNGGSGGKGGAQRSCLRANEPKNMVARCADSGALMVYS
jgi:hypothetical protein